MVWKDHHNCAFAILLLPPTDFPFLSLSSPLPVAQWRVRKEAMMGLASIYKKYSLQGEGGRDASKQISWIKDKLLHIYYQNSIDDRWATESPPGWLVRGGSRFHI